MKHVLDIETWSRKAHFNFFKTFDEPIYGVCVTIDCTAAYQFAKQQKVSFYLYTLYQALNATHAVEPFRYRIEGDEVFIYNEIIAASTIARANGTFGYGYIDHHANLDQFITEATKEVERVQARNDLELSSIENVIRFSSLPWVDFTSLSHARVFSIKNSCPSISFGKMTEKDGKRSMPMSIHVHHALVDGLHIGQYIDSFQQLMNG